MNFVVLAVSAFPPRCSTPLAGASVLTASVVREELRRADEYMRGSARPGDEGVGFEVASIFNAAAKFEESGVSAEAEDSREHEPLAERA